MNFTKNSETRRQHSLKLSANELVHSGNSCLQPFVSRYAFIVTCSGGFHTLPNVDVCVDVSVSAYVCCFFVGFVILLVASCTRTSVAQLLTQTANDNLNESKLKKVSQEQGRLKRGNGSQSRGGKQMKVHFHPVLKSFLVFSAIQPKLHISATFWQFLSYFFSTCNWNESIFILHIEKSSQFSHYFCKLIEFNQHSNKRINENKCINIFTVAILLLQRSLLLLYYKYLN